MMGYGKGLGGGPPKGGQFYKNNFAMQDDYGDEDLDDYGGYYAEEDSEDQEPQFAQNYPPGSMFSGGQKTAPMGMGAMGGLGGVSSASGVPFYGQQSKPIGGGGFQYGGIGGGAGAFMSGSTAPATGGGFTYGMASKGGNLFGPPSGSGIGAGSNPLSGGTQFGAASSSTQPGLFQFGKVSSFGGVGGGSTFGAGTAGGLFGASSATADDPYANIAIDLNKVKKSEPPPKLHELKTEEEKKKEAESKKAASNSTGKSLLKKDFDEKKNEDEDPTSRRKRSVTFGKSTTYEVERGETEESTEFINKEGAGGKGSPRPNEKKVIAEKDLSDGRSEKEKILEMLEKQQREQLEEIKQMNEAVKKDEPKSKNNYEDSVGESSSNSVPVPNKKAENSNSYDTDDFEDASVSGSGSKQKLTYWPGKDAFKDKKEAPQTKKQETDAYDPKAMEEYLKKQQQNKGAPSNQKPQPAKTYEPSESSDRYDDDFESISKSQGGLTSSMLPSPKGNQQKPQAQSKSTFEYKPVEFKSIAEQYKKKENQFVQTEGTKYDFMGPQDQTSGSYKEWTLQQHLKDAETLIQELKSQSAESKDKIKDLELQLKKKDMDFQAARRESMNANETAKRLQEQLKDSVHKNNLYKIETEELIKQIDLADAKTRNKEDELKLAQAEYERKLKLQEERILFRVSKQEERGNIELKREHMLEKEELQNKVNELQEELSYFNEKVAKIEADNKSLRLGKESSKRIKELEDEVEYLKHQLSLNIRNEQENINLKNIKNELSREDQIKLQRELQQLELMVRGYQEENEKAMVRQKQLEKDLKAAQDKAMTETKRARDLQQKALMNTEQVYIEQSKQEPDIQTVNNMGLSNAISQKTLQELHAQLQKLQNEKQDFERDLAIKEGQLKSQINKLKDEKTSIEKQLLDTEFLVNDKDREIQKLRDQFRSTQENLTQQVKELEDKVSWFRQNQRLIADDDADREASLKELTTLREKVSVLEQDIKRTRDLEKKCKLLEETIKSKNPNSIPMMLMAVKDNEAQEKQTSNQDKKRISQLEAELEGKDQEFEKKLRTYRQEMERMKLQYEKKNGQTPEAKRVQELENELQTTKNYYNKRIREIEDKYKFRIPEKEATKSKPPAGKSLKEQQPLSTSSAKPQIDISDQSSKNYDEIIDKLTKERNLLAQKVVNLETQNNRRRQSFSGITVTQTDGNKHPFQAINSICSMLKLSNDSKEQQFVLIEAALACVEQLKNKEPMKNKQISQLLLQLTQELNSNSKLNDQVLQDIMKLCQKEIQVAGLQPPHEELKLKQMHSASGPQMNKDLSGVFGSFMEESSKPAHPFVVHQPRDAKEVLKAIVKSGIDFERAVKERKLNPAKLQMNHIYQIIREEEPSLKTITLEEVKQVVSLVKEKNVFASEEIGRGKTEEIDLQDLMNVIMDVSLDVFGGVNQNDSVSLAHARYSQDYHKSPQQDEVRRLKEQLRKLQEETQNGDSGLQQKLEKMQEAIINLKSEKQQLLDKLEKLEASKTRVERILKQSMGSKSTLRKTANGQEPDMDLFEELGVLMKRIEFLEQQSEEREKMSYLEHGPCKRELQRLQQDLMEERQDKQRMLSKKNAEVAYFKSELDALLSEMRNTISSKKQVPVKF